ncbi:MAG: VWA domain-containing protein [Spirochaetales bacterium]|nr:VWA domain-containing protein [Spirochaetales bacterium]
MFKKILVLIIFFLLSVNSWAELDYIVMVDTSSSMAPFIDDLSKYLKLELVLNNLNKGDSFHLIRFADYPTFELKETLTGQDSIDRILKEVGFLKAKLLFGKYTDIISAIEYLIDYAESLNGLDEKVLILLSDGIHDPPQDSPYANMSPSDVRDVINHFANTIIEKNGWRIHLNRIPTADYFNFDKFKNNSNDLKNTESSLNNQTDKPLTLGQDDNTIDIIDELGAIDKSHNQTITNDNTTNLPDHPNSNNNEQGNPDNQDSVNIMDRENWIYDVFDPLSDALEQEIYEYPTDNPDNNDELLNRLNGFPKLEFPGNLGTKGRYFTIPFHVINFSKEQIILELSSLMTENRELLLSPLKPKRFPPNQRTLFDVPVVLPEDFPKGEYELPIVLSFSDSNRIYPRQGTIQFQYNGSLDIFANLSNFFDDYGYVVLLILSALAFGLIVFLLIRSHLLSNLFTDFLKPPEWRDRMPVGEKKGDRLVEMRVDFQNHKIGFRNIHNLTNGKKFSIGGGSSHYLIFLVPIDAHVAEITNQEGSYIFIPIKPEFFPDIHAPIVNCLNQDITMVSPKGYTMTLRFSLYISPLLQLNNILHQADRSINPEIE